MARIIRVKAIVIGDRVIDHQISIPDAMGDMSEVAKEFLKRSYPQEFKSITDITAKEIKKPT